MVGRYPLEWTFHLDVNYAWIESFVSRYSGIDVVIISDEQDAGPTQYSWSSPHLNGLTDSAEIGNRAAALKALFDGAMLVSREGDFRSSPASRPIEYLSGDINDFQLRAPFEPFCGDWASWTFKSIENPTRHPVSLFLFLAHFSATAKQMLIFLGANGVSWISLYALKDFMGNEGWSEDDMATAGGVPVGEIKRFRATANNHAAIGPFARHGEVGWLPPSNPMTLDEAEAVILKCVKGFFASLAKEYDIESVFKSRSR